MGGVERRRFFTIVPAAGESLRMGRPKLLLPVQGAPLIAATLAAWQHSQIDQLVVVVRPGDDALRDACQRAGALVVVPEAAPPDMKASIQAGLAFLDATFQPDAADAFLVAPADMPQLSPAIIDRLIENHQAAATPTILAPELDGKRGHPVLFPWPLAELVQRLLPQEGLNALVDRGPLVLVGCDDLAVPGERPFADVDTPADYEQLE